ncbi:shikimate dehydrogenase [Rhizobium rhizogenes]|uniref:shikimate dehydrogenase n=1 Tax=Rhizobium rhizogenes TaxID=359 RepID=UPI0009B92779|nr:shikimate dehydrogenase [Rhizobium rhizogenes]
MSEVLIAPRVLRVGLIGSGIGGSLSPAMHMQEGARLGLDYTYDIIDLQELGCTVSDLPKLIDNAEKNGFAGLNITHPCKQAAVALVDELSADAAVLRSINTVVFRNGRRFGHNTDWWGFAESFRRGLPGASLERVVQLGAGGAGVAVAHAVAGMGAKSVEIYDLDQAKVSALISQIQAAHPHCDFVAGTDLPAALQEATGLVHATPTGMLGHPGLPLGETLIDARFWVADIVYFPLETQLVKAAKSKGCRVLDGGGMAVFQAVGAFELFTGSQADSSRMIAHFKSLQAR